MSIINVTDYDVTKMDTLQRANIRGELAEMWERLPADGLSATISAQVLQTALHAIDAIDRVQALADDLGADNGPARAASFAFALEIRTALEGN